MEAEQRTRDSLLLGHVGRNVRKTLIRAKIRQLGESLRSGQACHPCNLLQAAPTHAQTGCCTLKNGGGANCTGGAVGRELKGSKGFVGTGNWHGSRECLLLNTNFFNCQAKDKPKPTPGCDSQHSSPSVLRGFTAQWPKTSSYEAVTRSD